MSTSLVILDTETTGLQPDRHTIWEIAWITALHEGNTLCLHRRFETFVDISALELLDADPAALRVGMFERYLPDLSDNVDYIKQKLMDDCSEIAERAGNSVPHLVGAVPSFDHAMMTRWFGWPGFGENIYHYHLVDVEAVMAGRLGLAPPWNSKELSARLGVAVDESRIHTAMGDAEWAMRCYAAAYDLTIIVPQEERP